MSAAGSSNKPGFRNFLQAPGLRKGVADSIKMTACELRLSNTLHLFAVILQAWQMMVPGLQLLAASIRPKLAHQHRYSRMAGARMCHFNKLSAIYIFWTAATILCAQDLVPRAYLVTPVASNAVTVSASYFDGSVFTDPTVPITDFKARFSASILSYSRSFAFFGRSANVVASVPYAIGTFRGVVVGAERSVYRSGLADGRIRFAMNLRGGPAMGLREFVKWREKFILGASLTIITPIGQYDPAKLINPGLNRWAFKPELGMARRWGRWAVDLYGGIWLFTPNSAYYPGTARRTQAPVGALETHLSYTLKPRLWASLDGNFWTGGRSTVNQTANRDYQRNSRVGVTVSVPLNQHQALKFGYSAGAYISIGGDYKNVSAAWQYSWLSRPK